MQVFDQAGNLVRTIKTDPLASGKHSVKWDGESDNGEEFPDGNYYFSVKATDGEGNNVGALAMHKRNCFVSIHCAIWKVLVFGDNFFANLICFLNGSKNFSAEA